MTTVSSVGYSFLPPRAKDTIQRSFCFLDDQDDPDDGGVRLYTPSFAGRYERVVSFTRDYSQLEQGSLRLSKNSVAVNAVPSKREDSPKLKVPATRGTLLGQHKFSAMELDSDTDDCKIPQVFQDMVGHGSMADLNQTFAGTFGAFSSFSPSFPQLFSAHKPAEILLPVRQPTTAQVPSDQTRSSIGFYVGRRPGLANNNNNNNLRAHSASSVSAPHVEQPAPATTDNKNITRGFRPMSTLSSGRAARTSRASRPGSLSDASRFSENYLGERTPQNASARDLRPEDNCALWLTNLPADVAHRDVLAAIRGVGRVWCCVINRPDFDTHVTAAAKVVFFRPGPAQALITHSLAGGIAVGGRPVKVTHNRVKYSQKPAKGPSSRVLIITGKRHFVNEEALAAYFGGLFTYDVDKVVTLIAAGDRAVVEFSFASYRCQSQMGKMALERDCPEGFEKAEFGEDPCEVGETMSSYGVAGHRIQGLGI